MRTNGASQSRTLILLVLIKGDYQLSKILRLAEITAAILTPITARSPKDHSLTTNRPITNLKKYIAMFITTTLSLDGAATMRGLCLPRRPFL